MCIYTSYLPCGFPTVWKVTILKIGNNNNRLHRDSWEEEDHARAPHNFISLVSQNNPPSKDSCQSYKSKESQSAKLRDSTKAFPSKKMSTILESVV